MLKLHGRQFVLGPERVQASPDWVHAPVPGWGILSSCPALPIAAATDRDGVEWRILGAAWAAPSPAEQISRARTTEVSDLYRRWSGRWILIGDGQLHTDAAALLGCYYRGEWASSSAALLARDDRPEGRPLRHEVMLDWCPPPCSRFARVRRLLASQVLHRDGEVAPRPLLVEPAPQDYVAVLEELEALLLSAVRAASRMGSLCIPLSGGWDSRLVLAATHAAGLAARTFTQGYASIPHGDRELPPELSRSLGYEHSYVEPRAAEVDSYRIYDEHTAAHSCGADRAFVARGQWDWCRSGDIVLRGGGFEIGRLGWARLLHRLDRSDYRELAASDWPDAIARSAGDSDTRARAALAEWATWCSRHAEPMDWRERFYWEQRVGGWMSAVEQSLDLLPARRGYVANSHRFYELVLSLPEDVRRASGHHRDLIGRLAPKLLDFPFNPPDPLPMRLRRKAVRALNEWYHRFATGASRC